MRLLRLLILKPVLAVCLLTSFISAPVPGQTGVSEEPLSPAGDFPAIDADGLSGFVSVWVENLDSGQEIFGSLVPPGGSSPGTPFQVNARARGRQVAPSVAAGPQGDFMVVWQAGAEVPTGGDTNLDDVFGQVFTRAGARVGPERRLNERTAGLQVKPRVTALPDSSFVAVWEDQSTAPVEIVARRFSATGGALGPEQRLSVAGESNFKPRVAPYKNGFAVAWTEEIECTGNQPAGSRAVIARFDSSGRRAGKLIRIGRLTCGESTALDALAGSRAGVMAFLRTRSGYSVQRLGPSGEIVGKPVAISRPLCGGAGLGTYCRYLLDASMNDQGRFAVVWVVAADPTIFYTQVFKPDFRGTSGSEIGFGSITGSTPVVALANDGTVAAAVRQDSGLGDGNLVLQRYRAP